MIDADDEQLSISRQCELLGLRRSSYYRMPTPETQENDTLMRIIDEEYTRHPFLGSRGMRDYLRLSLANIHPAMISTRCKCVRDVLSW